MAEAKGRQKICPFEQFQSRPTTPRKLRNRQKQLKSPYVDDSSASDENSDESEVDEWRIFQQDTRAARPSTSVQVVDRLLTGSAKKIIPLSHLSSKTTSTDVALEPPGEARSSHTLPIRTADPAKTRYRDTTRTPRRRKHYTGESLLDPFFDPTKYDILSTKADTPPQELDTMTRIVQRERDDGEHMPHTPPKPIPKVDFTTFRPSSRKPKRTFLPTPIKPTHHQVSGFREPLSPVRAVAAPSQGGYAVDEVTGTSKGKAKVEVKVKEKMQSPDDLADVLNTLLIGPSPSVHSPPKSPTRTPNSMQDQEVEDLAVCTHEMEGPDLGADVSFPSQEQAMTDEPSALELRYVTLAPGIFLPNDDQESEDDWVPQTTKKPTGKPRRIIQCDSGSDSDSPAPVRRGVNRPRISHIIDLVASDSNDGSSDGDVGAEDDVEDIDEEYDVVKHYDESYGSLRDFIVGDSDDEGEEEVDTDHILRYSPPGRPRQIIPDIQALTISSSSDSNDDSDDSLRPSTSKNKVKVKRSAQPKRNRLAWEVERADIVDKVFRDLDERVFASKLGQRGAKTKIEWSKRLLTTAGTATCNRITRPDGSRAEEAKITLSDKVLTAKEPILCTVAHEMCHLACWVISNERKNPHGRVFKSWGRKVMRVRKDIEVTTKHDYEIEYKYEWKCDNPRCGRIFRRHSKSIDPKKQACRCGGKLEPLFAIKASTAFQIYLKANMSYAKAALPKAAHGQVMRALSSRWTHAPQSTPVEHTAFWRTMATA